MNRARVSYKPGSFMTACGNLAWLTNFRIASSQSTRRVNGELKLSPPVRDAACIKAPALKHSGDLRIGPQDHKEWERGERDIGIAPRETFGPANSASRLLIGSTKSGRGPQNVPKHLPCPEFNRGR